MGWQISGLPDLRPSSVAGLEDKASPTVSPPPPPGFDPGDARSYTRALVPRDYSEPDPAAPALTVRLFSNMDLITVRLKPNKPMIATLRIKPMVPPDSWFSATYPLQDDPPGKPSA